MLEQQPNVGEEHAGLTHSPQFKLLYLAHYQVLAALKELLEHIADHWVVSPLKEGTKEGTKLIGPPSTHCPRVG